MRCPVCGFVSFDSLSACKRCGREVPRHGGSVGIVVIPRGNSTPPPPPGEAKAPEPSPRDASVVVEPAEAEGPVETAAPAAAASPRTAGFWLRTVAFLVDAALVAVLASAGAILVEMAVRVGGLFSSATEAGLEWLETTATVFFTVLIALCYFTLFVGLRGQTPGKMLLGLKITRTSGEEVGYGRAFVRWIGQVLGLLPFGLGFLMVAFSRRKQGLHDKLAATHVVRLSS